VTTIVAYALGVTIATKVLGAIPPPFGAVLGGMAAIALFGVVFGAAVGVVQLVALRGAGRVRSGPWTVTTMLGGAVGFMAAALVGETLGDLISPTGSIVIGGGTIEITSGAVLGLAIGVAQSSIARRRAWILASAVGAGLGYGAATAALELLEVPVLKANLIPAFGAILGLFIGLAQGVVLVGYRRPSATSASD